MSSHWVGLEPALHAVACRNHLLDLPFVHCDHSSAMMKGLYGRWQVGRFGVGSATAIQVHTAPLEHESDISALAKLVSDGRIRPEEICAVTGKTEGNYPGENSRGAALSAFRTFLSEHSTLTDEQIASIPVVLSSGGVGILAPHLQVYTRTPWDGPVSGEPRLVLGSAMSVPMKPEWIGHPPMVKEVAGTVRAAAANAGIDSADAEYVLLKTYGLQPADIAEAAARGVEVQPFVGSLAARKVNGAASLAVAVAVDGLPMPSDDEIAANFDLWTGKASASVGREDPRTHVLLFGNSVSAGGTLRVGHAVMMDLLDIAALHRALRAAGLTVEDDRPLSAEVRRRIAAVYVKVGTPVDARLRGRRQVHEGQNPTYGGELKAAVAGMYSAFLQDTILYISSAATHQGPAGGGTVAVVVDHG